MSKSSRFVQPTRRVIPGKSTQLTVVIPAAGKGLRMKSKDVKSLSKLKETTILQRQLELIWQNYPNSDILVVGGYRVKDIREAVKDYPVRIIFNPLFETTNVAFSIGLALQASISNTCLLVYGDLVFNSQAIDNIVGNGSKLLLDNGNLNSEEVGLIVDAENYITNLAFGLEQRWGQIAYLENKELELFREICYNENAARWFGYEALNNVINRGGIIKGYNSPSSFVFDIDTPRDLEKAKESI